MKRWVTLAVGVVAVVVGAFFVVSALESSDPPHSGSTTGFATASLPLAKAVKPSEPDLPDIKYSRTMFASTTLSGVDGWLDRCGGPIAVDVGEGHPTLISEHDYCGGSAWMWDLHTGDVVSLDGKGIDKGLYEVVELKYLPRKSGASVSDLPEGDAVLQTCVSATQMVLVALEKYEPDTV